MKVKNILILGGYGGVGRVIAELLLKYTAANIIIAGRKIEKAEELADQLNNKFSTKNSKKKRAQAVYADTSNKESLETAFKNINLVIVCTTSPEDILLVAKTSLDCQIDYLDIQFEQKVFQQLQTLESEMNKSGRLFITQAGFHPGLPAVFIREGAKYFDQYNKAIIAMAMNSKFERPESTKDLVNSVREFNAHVFKNNQWKKADYQDIIKIDFGKIKMGKMDLGTENSVSGNAVTVGVKKCYPLDLIEIKEMVRTYKLKEAGIYVCGFNWFVDNIVFPLIIVSHKLKKNSLTLFFQWLTYFGINTFSPKKSYVVFLLNASGWKNNNPKNTLGSQHQVNLQIKSSHSDPYLFTAAPVVACVKQYLSNKIKLKGLRMMGHIVDTGELFNDLKKMGIKIEIKKS